MPVVPTVGAAPYETASYVLDVVRMRLNDAVNGIGGDTVKNDQPFVKVAFNSGFRRMQKYLNKMGYNRLTRRAIISAIPVVSDLDPASECWIDWSNYFDGNNFYDSPVVPEDMIIPLRLWERPTGQNWGFTPMGNYIDGMPSYLKQGFNRIWEWREDKVYFPGAISVTDIQMRYAAYLPKLIDTTDDQGQPVPWYEQPVRIVDSTDSLAYFICFEICSGRGDTSAADFQTLAQAEANELFDLEVRQKQRTNLKRISRSAGARCGNWIY